MEPIYPNSPLNEVILEVRFPGEPAVETHRDEFFEHARSEFPQVFVPNVQLGEAVALQPYHFRSEDGKRALITALNRFAYTSQSYPGWNGFKEEALTWTRRFGERFHISTLTRTGLRYINHISFPPGDDFPVDRFLRFDLGLGDHRGHRMRDLLVAVVIPVDDGSLTVRVGSAQGNPKSGIMILDFDFAFAGELEFAKIESYFETSHAETKRFFEGLITPEYRDFMKGEGIE